MARMIPSEPDADAPPSEREVFRLLRGGLPDSVTVLHARRFVLPAVAGGRKVEGEADFVVLDPERGLLVLEVKGGGVEREDGRWYSRDGRGERHRISDPGKQAQNAAHQLDRHLAERDDVRRALPRGVGRAPFGWGVVLPDVDVRGDLGVDLPRALVLDRLDLASASAAVARVFDGAGLVRRDGPHFEPALRSIAAALAPHVRLVPSLAARIRSDEPVLVRLTEEQASVLDVLQLHRRAAIQGTAGSGKTLVAMEKARRLVAQGERVLLLCFNRLLAAHLRARAEGFDVDTFHNLARTLVERAGMPFQVPEPRRSQQRFWNEDAATLLRVALERLSGSRWDAVIVDEGQDFRDGWWAAVEALMSDPERGTLYAFFDPNQEIYGGGPAKALGVLPAQLTHNCRNTAKIARWCADRVAIDPGVRAGTPEGVEVRELVAERAADVPRLVEQALLALIRDGGLTSEQVVVLSTRTPQKSALAGHRTLGDLVLVPPEQRERPSQIAFLTLHAFKGLEADAVILCDVREGEPTSSDRHLYVGGSRARHVLVVVRSPNV